MYKNYIDADRVLSNISYLKVDLTVSRCRYPFSTPIRLLNSSKYFNNHNYVTFQPDLFVFFPYVY